MSVLEELTSLVNELITIARDALMTSADVDGSAAERRKRVDEIEAALKTSKPAQPLCRGRWVPGMIQAPNAPPAIGCRFESGHSGFCSFIRDAQARGWEVPHGIVERMALRHCRKRGFALVHLHDVEVTTEADRWAFRVRFDENIKGFINRDGTPEWPT